MWSLNHKKYEPKSEKHEERIKENLDFRFGVLVNISCYFAVVQPLML